MRIMAGPKWFGLSVVTLMVIMSHFDVIETSPAPLPKPQPLNDLDLEIKTRHLDKSNKTPPPVFSTTASIPKDEPISTKFYVVLLLLVFITIIGMALLCAFCRAESVNR